MALKTEKLLWSGVTESEDSKKLDKVVSQVAKEVVAKMKEDGFIPAK